MKLKKAPLIGAALVLVAAVAYAQPPNSYTTIYYNDAAHSAMVGKADFTCSGNWYRSGEETAYFDITNEHECNKGGWDIDPWG